jgi:hypothetical protein
MAAEGLRNCDNPRVTGAGLLGNGDEFYKPSSNRQISVDPKKIIGIYRADRCFGDTPQAALS